MKTSQTIVEMMLNAPHNMVTVVLPEGTIFEIVPERQRGDINYARNIGCAKCERGVVTYITSYSLVTVKATNGADINLDIWEDMEEAYKDLWVMLFKAGCLQNSILIDEDGNEYANPLDIDPVTFSEVYSELTVCPKCANDNLELSVKPNFTYYCEACEQHFGASND